MAAIKVKKLMLYYRAKYYKFLHMAREPFVVHAFSIVRNLFVKTSSSKVLRIFLKVFCKFRP